MDAPLIVLLPGFWRWPCLRMRRPSRRRTPHGIGHQRGADCTCGAHRSSGGSPGRCRERTAVADSNRHCRNIETSSRSPTDHTVRRTPVDQALPTLDASRSTSRKMQDDKLLAYGSNSQHPARFAPVQAAWQMLGRWALTGRSSRALTARITKLDGNDHESRRRCPTKWKATLVSAARRCRRRPRPPMSCSASTTVMGTD